MDSVIVGIRVKPLNDREWPANRIGPWLIDSQSISQCNNQGAVIRAARYNMDRIFSHEATNEVVYEQFAKPIIASTMNGFNGTIFAYGQTSSGKTHTMRGDLRSNPGIIPLAVGDIFSIAEHSDSREYFLRVSYMEIYNEVIRDLLNPEATNLKIHESAEKGVFVGDLREVSVQSIEEVMSLLASGEARRHVGATNMNEYSSRSHTIFQVFIESREIIPAVGEDLDESVRLSVLNLVDLAGSERVSLTGAEGLRLKEGVHINKSLLTLSTVIAKLSEGCVSHIPYRESKLTRILQPSLGGNARTAIVCTVNPAAMYSDETNSTLKFASRAKQIKNKPKVNEMMDEKAQLRTYEKQIRDLKKQMETSVNTAASQKALEQLQEEKQKIELDKEEKEKQLKDLESHVSRLMHMLTTKADFEKKSKSRLRRETWAADCGSGNDMGEMDMSLDLDFKKPFHDMFGPAPARKSSEDLPLQQPRSAAISASLFAEEPKFGARLEAQTPLQKLEVDGTSYDADAVRELVSENAHLRDELYALQQEKLILMDQKFTLEREVEQIPDFTEENEKLKVELDKAFTEIEDLKLGVEQERINTNEKIELAKSLLMELEEKSNKLDIADKLIQLLQTRLNEAEMRCEEIYELANMKDTIINDLTIKVVSANEEVQNIRQQLESTPMVVESGPAIAESKPISTSDAEIQFSIEKDISEISVQTDDLESPVNNEEIMSLKSICDESLRTIETLKCALSERDLQILAVQSETKSIIEGKDTQLLEMNAELCELKASQTILDEKISFLEKKLAETEVESTAMVKSFEERISVKDDEVAESSRLNLALTSELELLKVSQSEISTKCLELECISNSRERLVNELYEQIGKHPVALAEKDHDIEQHREVIQSLEKTIHELTSQIEGLEMCLAQKGEEWECRFSEQKKLVEDTERALQFEKEDLEKCQEALNETRKTLKSLNPQQVQKDKENNRKEMEKLQKKIEELDGKLKQVTQEKQTLTGEKTTKEQEFKSLEKKYKMVESQLEKLKAADTKAKDQTKKIEILSKKTDELNIQVDKLREDLAKKTQQHETLTSEYEKVKASLLVAEEKIAELHASLNEKSEKLEAVTNELNTKTEQLADATSKIDSLRTELENMKSVYERIALSLHESQKRNEELSQENAKLKENEIATANQISKLKADLESNKMESSKALENLQGEYAKLNSEATGIRGELEELRIQKMQEVETLKSKITSLEEIVSSKSSAIKSLESEIHSLKSQNEGHENSIKQLMKEKLVLCENIESIRNEMKSAEAIFRDKQISMEHTISEKCDEIDSLRRRADETEQSLKSSITDLYQELEQKKYSIQSYAERFTGLNETIMNIREENDALKKKNESCENTIDALKSEKADLAETIRSLSFKLNNMEEIISSLRDEVSSATDDLKESEALSKKLSSQVQKLEATVQSTSEEIDKLKMSIKQTESALESKNRDLLSTQEKHEKLKMRFEEEHSELEKLRDKLKSDSVISLSKDEQIRTLEEMVKMHANRKEKGGAEKNRCRPQSAFSESFGKQESAGETPLESDSESEVSVQQKKFQELVTQIEQKAKELSERDDKIKSLEIVAQQQTDSIRHMQDARDNFEKLLAIEVGKVQKLECEMEFNKEIVTQLRLEMEEKDAVFEEQGEMIAQLLETNAKLKDSIEAQNLAAAENQNVESKSIPASVQSLPKPEQKNISTQTTDTLTDNLVLQLDTKQEEVAQLKKLTETQKAKIKEFNGLVDAKQREIDQLEAQLSQKTDSGQTNPSSKEVPVQQKIVVQNENEIAEVDNMRKRMKELVEENKNGKRAKRELIVSKRDNALLSNALRVCEYALESSLVKPTAQSSNAQKTNRGANIRKEGNPSSSPSKAMAAQSKRLSFAIFEDK